MQAPVSLALACTGYEAAAGCCGVCLKCVLHVVALFILVLHLLMSAACLPLLRILQENVNRLKAYKSNLVVFPRARNAKKPKVRHPYICTVVIVASRG